MARSASSSSVSGPPASRPWSKPVVPCATASFPASGAGCAGVVAAVSDISRKMRLTASAAASLASALRSAPTYPAVRRAMCPMSKTPASRSLRATTSRMRLRAGSSGMPRQISRSKRPARRSAASRASGRFVAPMTTTWARWVVPAPPSPPAPPPSPAPPRSSMHARSWATIRRSISRCALSRFGAMASISSMKITDGAAAAAAEKSARTFASDSPLIPLTTSGAAMEKNGTDASVAMA
mmetsp:Transcript_22698/g.73857  ORF Transcript_22698/g.73857 Transcript_22698/m.73857 type:complete len:239 (-) Transcript_22698:621-1337(-)